MDSQCPTPSIKIAEYDTFKHRDSGITQPTMKPFLKWAGSKTKIVKHLRPLFPEGEYRLIEPFVGSGVVFLNTAYPKSLLADTNADIVDLFKTLKDKGTDFINRCRRLFTAENNTEKRFYELRTKFNKSKVPETRAAIFLYLNRHCFNGLCRYNKSGEFNTPFGRYKSVYFPTTEMEAFVEKLGSAEIVNKDFRKVLPKTGKGDIVYCDPPYVPLSATANFTNYASGGFSQDDQKDLTNLCVESAKRGAVVVVSNHDTPFTRELYQNANQLIPLLVSRTISCDGENRKKVKELIAIFREDAI